VAQHETLCAEHVKLLNRVPDIEHKLDVLVGTTEVYFKMMDRYTTSIIHSPQHQERDELGDKLNAGTINCKEAHRLSELLAEMIADETNPEKKFAAILQHARVEALMFSMRARMKRERHDNNRVDPGHTELPAGPDQPDHGCVRLP
jgi:hypothetical protein